MMEQATLQQDPPPGRHLLRCRGDALTFTLTLPADTVGSAWVRSNIGQVAVSRREIVERVDTGFPPLARDWFDLPMARVDARRFRITLPLGAVGHFEAKCFFLRDGSSTPDWPPGGNTVINVEPADSCCANIVYNAFVRQFGPNRDGRAGERWKHLDIESLDREGFAAIPPSGKFRDLLRSLDFIIGELGCTVIQLLPIHPTPTTFARMGRFGSPYAALSFTDVDPALAEFDPAATPLEQFEELVDGVHARGARLFLDIAINHTGWAARLHASHPEWLVRQPDGRIEVPGAWGVNWEDLTRLDYGHQGLWTYMAEVFLAWCRRGVDGFRCDAGYMIPLEAWRYMVAKVREQFPDTVFFLEGLGGKISVTRELLNHANLNWAYSELFQNYTREQIEAYLPGALDIAESDGLTLNFAETHDNPRLAARSPAWARMRTALCALFAPWGAFGFANGLEWLAREKINVHHSPSLNWGAPENQVAEIRRLTDLLKHHPVFQAGARLELVQEGPGNVAVMLRHHRPSGQRLLVVANLDDDQAATAAWNPVRCGLEVGALTDLLTGRTLALPAADPLHRMELKPGEVLCLSPDAAAYRVRFENAPFPAEAPERRRRQRLRAKVLDVLVAFQGLNDLGDLDLDAAAEEFARSPWDFCRRHNPISDEPRVIRWSWPRDARRDVVVPQGHGLLLEAPHAFRVHLVEEGQIQATEDSLADDHGQHFALLFLAPTTGAAHSRHPRLELRLHGPQGTRHVRASLTLPPDPEAITIPRGLERPRQFQKTLLFLGTNGRGGMCRAAAQWARLESRYDALLAANLSPDYPEDRFIMLTRLRGWVVYQGHYHEIRHDGLEGFAYHPPDRCRWTFRFPTGQGQNVRLFVDLKMLAGENALRVTFTRHPAEGISAGLPDHKPIRLIIRPDVESRGFHDVTKAYLGAELDFPSAVVVGERGFRFQPGPAGLELDSTSGRFVAEHEWHYMVHRPLEAERGLDPDSDLFSPGYFQVELAGGEGVTLAAEIRAPAGGPAATAPASLAELPREPDRAAAPEGVTPEEALAQAMQQFVVRRGLHSTVVAGYPWFLDWGRDTLIFVRGLIAAGDLTTARAIIRQFAGFEEHGTLPNMIRGDDARNRNTSDASLWLFAAVADLVASEGHTQALGLDCRGRSLGRILEALAEALTRGTPNGIHMDPGSGLLFSPAHFTWMDTNHPAATPRQGYPVEIQALWHCALAFLAAHGPTRRRRQWAKRAAQVREGLAKRFFSPELGYCFDCLRAEAGQGVENTQADDALRPNQLLAVTLGAIGDRETARRIVHACEELVIPGAMRSLADRPVRCPAPVYHQGRLLNDPQQPYQGRYEGDEDTRRKPAYHNGTAWTWVFPSFCEAWVMAYGRAGYPTARSWLASCLPLMTAGCVGHLPEILDGDAPHAPRGCDAQAWSVSEVYRVWRLLAGRDGAV
jgi:starch synthase (maltosyl-transferring)